MKLHYIIILLLLASPGISLGQPVLEAMPCDSAAQLLRAKELKIELLLPQKEYYPGELIDPVLRIQNNSDKVLLVPAIEPKDITFEVLRPRKSGSSVMFYSILHSHLSIYEINHCKAALKILRPQEQFTRNFYPNDIATLKRTGDRSGPLRADNIIGQGRVRASFFQRELELDYMVRDFEIIRRLYISQEENDSREIEPQARRLAVIRSGDLYILTVTSTTYPFKDIAGFDGEIDSKTSEVRNLRWRSHGTTRIAESSNLIEIESRIADDKSGRLPALFDIDISSGGRRFSLAELINSSDTLRSNFRSEPSSKTINWRVLE